MTTKPEPQGRRRSAARLAAVQALYELELVGAETDPVIQGFLEKRWVMDDDAGDDDAGDNAGASTLAEPDSELLGCIVRGVWSDRAELDAALGGALAKEWPLERLEALLRAILRAGAFELKSLGEVPPRVVISEYVEVTHAFFDGKQAGLVNGVLDRLARTLRPRELEDDRGEQKAESR